MLKSSSELEYSALHVVNRPDIQTSELSMQHLQDVNLDTRPDSPFAVAVHFMLKFLSQEYADVPQFCAVLDGLMQRVNTNFISTARRLELELMHTGRVSLEQWTIKSVNS